MSAAEIKARLGELAMETPPDLRIRGGDVLDLVRRRWVRLTPEEWVRQHVIGWLRDRIGVPTALMAVEREVIVGGMKRRVDVLVRDRAGAVWMVVEVKAAAVPVGQPVADQVGWYDSALKARFVLVTNGHEVRGWERDENGNFRIMSGLPYFRSNDPVETRV